MQKKIVYLITADWEGKVDIYFPKETTQLKPLVLNVQGELDSQILRTTNWFRFFLQIEIR